MKQRIEERRPAITPQLALRVAVLGGFAFVLFAIVFFRLWFLQVLTGEQYVSQARENRVRKVKIEAPRGNIVDRNGAVGDVVIVQSLEPSLDVAARKAFEQWQFRPATRAGEPVPMAVSVQMAFTAR